MLLKDVKARCKMDCKVKTIMYLWKNMVDSPCEESYVEIVMQFRKVCNFFSKFRWTCRMCFNLIQE